MQGEFDRHVRDAHLPDGDRKVRAHVLRRLKCLLEDSIEDRSRRAPRLGRGVGFLDLAENFRLADHLGVQARGDFEQMLQGLLPAQVEAKFSEFGRIELLSRAEGGLDARRGAGIRRHAVKFHPIAGVENRELAEPASERELRVKRRLGLGGEREFLPHVQGRGAVGGPNDKKCAGAHGLESRLIRRAGRGCRLAFTGPSEIRAAAKRTRQVQAKRFASSRPLNLATRAAA